MRERGRRWQRGALLVALGSAMVVGTALGASDVAQAGGMRVESHPTPHRGGAWSGHPDPWGWRRHDDSRFGDHDRWRHWGYRPDHWDHWRHHPGWSGSPGWYPGGWAPRHAPVWVPPRWVWNGWAWVLAPGYWR